jgi:predicted Zn-dependent protease with MMP-like domain
MLFHKVRLLSISGHNKERIMDDWSHAQAPSLDDIEALALDARDALPEAFAAAACQVLLRVADFAPDDLLEEMEIDDPFELTGLYEGVPLTEKSVTDQGVQPDTIWLFRRPILDEWATRGDIGLGALVTHVLVHELAHHFGWSDQDIAKIDRWWE